ncbi:hypothetical protein [Candidatus Mycobacterium methanotrophicum]|nr:hypothetical protein [Candidatus Mycobacterium methanotrophicum]
MNDYPNQHGVVRYARPDVLIEMPMLPTTPVGTVDKLAIAQQMQP